MKNTAEEAVEGVTKSTPLHDEVRVQIDILDGRKETYGDATRNMIGVAKIWSGILGVPIEPWQVPLMLMGLKLQRANASPDYADNIDDILGWGAVFREVVGEDMIEAETAKEYQRKKADRDRF